MTVDELEEWIARAEKMVGHQIRVVKRYDGNWDLQVADVRVERDLVNGTSKQLISHLLAMATPPKPATLTITVPFSWAEARAGGPSMQLGDIDKVSKACREAIKPWAQS